jgi:hypothetical protein
MLTDTSLRTFEITVSLNPDGSLRFDPSPDVTASRGDHIVLKSDVGDLVLFIQGAEDKTQWARKSPFKKFLYADGRDNGNGEARINPQVKADAELLGYKYTLILFDDNGGKHEEDPRIVIR